MDALISSGIVGANEVEASIPGGQVVRLGLLLEEVPLREEKEVMIYPNFTKKWEESVPRNLQNVWGAP